jgi:hypothetical protein
MHSFKAACKEASFSATFDFSSAQTLPVAHNSKLHVRGQTQNILDGKPPPSHGHKNPAELESAYKFAAKTLNSKERLCPLLSGHRKITQLRMRLHANKFHPCPLCIIKLIIGEIRSERTPCSIFNHISRDGQNV